MIKCFEFPLCSFCLINYADFLKQTEVKIINDLDSYDLLDKLNLRNHDTRKVFYHHIIKDICELILNKKTKNKAVLLFNPQELELELFNYRKKDDVVSFLTTITKKIKSMIPVCVYHTDDQFKMYENKYTPKAVIKEKTAMISHLIDTQDRTKYNFAKIKKFAKDYQLTYLSETYFYNIKTKNLMFV